LLKTNQDLEVQFDALWSSTSKTSTNDKASTSQVSVETCDYQIAQENDHLKREVKKLKLKVNNVTEPPQEGVHRQDQLERFSTKQEHNQHI
jgi:hypothetical protein